MEQRARYAVVGAFVLLLGSAGVALALWLGFAGEAKQYVTYAVFMTESVAGLNDGAAVKYRGVNVGRVRQVTLDREDPSRVRLLLDIEQGVPIKADTVAVLESLGVTGIAHVNLSGGSRDSPPLRAAAGKPYPVIRSGPSLLVRLDTAVSALLAEMREAAAQLKLVAENVSRLVASDNVAVAEQILDNVRALTQQLAGHAAGLADSVENVNRITAGAAAAGAEIPKLVEQVGTMLAALQRTSSAIAAAAGDVRQLAGDAREELRAAAQSTIPELAGALREIRQLAETLGRLGRELERDPSALVRGRGSQRRGPGE